MQNPWILTAFGLCLTFVVRSQNQFEISGSLKEINGDPVPFANILLLNALDSSLVKGEITDDDGRFKLTTNEADQYILSASSIGHKQVYMEIALNSETTPLDIGVLQTEPLARLLDEVVISARKPLFQQEIDRTVVNVQSSITAAGGTVLDVLERSPGVTVDRMNNTLSLSGKSGVRIMINGKLTRMPMSAAVEMLGGMNADNVEKIELITTPPAKYEAEGNAGMINIVVKVSAEAGTNGNISLFTGYGRKEKYGGSINFNHRRNNFNLYGDYSYRFNSFPFNFDWDRTVQIMNEPVNTFVDNDREGPRTGHNGRFGFDWDLGKHTSIGALFSISDQDWDQSAIFNITETRSGRPSAGIFMTEVEQNDWQLILGNLNISHDFGDKSLSMDIDYIEYQAQNPHDYLLDFFDAGGVLTSEGALRSRKNTPIDTWVSKIDYAAKINEKTRLEMGVKGSFSKLNNDISVENLENGEWTIEPKFTSNANLTENILAAYTSLAWSPSDVLDLQVGLRYEHTRTDIDTREKPNVVNRRFGNFFPSIFINKKINKDQSWVLSYSRRISRPTFFQLAPFVVFSDPNSFVSGNTRLLPSLTDALKAEYRYKSILLSVQFSHDKDAIAGFQPRVNEQNQQVLLAENLDFQDNYGLTVSFPIYISSWWDMQYNMTVSLTRGKASYLETPITFSTSNFNFNGSQNFKLPRGISIELTGSFQKINWGVLNLEPFGALNFGVEKKFKNTASKLRASYSDMLNTSKWDITAEVPEEGLVTRTLIDFETRILTLTYSTSFGNQKLKTRQRNSTGSDEEQRRFN